MRQRVKPGWIVTVRHGRPDMDRTVRITAAEYETWWADYNLSGLAPGETPPPELVDLSRDAQLRLSSGLRRAKETAAAVCAEEVIEAHDLFNEAPLPRPPLAGIKLKPGTWGFVSRVFWFVGYSRGGESHFEAIRRANKAANFLIDRATSGGNVLLCAHGYFNWMINVALRMKGWRRTYDGGHHFWSWREYVRD